MRLGVDTLLKYQELLRNQNYDYKQNEELFKLYKTAEGKQKILIRNKIIEANLLLVIVFLMKNYNYEIDANPVFDMDDIVQEGSLLLLKCIDEYDVTRGKFSTYVYRKLESSIYYVNGIPNTPVQFYRGLSCRYKRVKKYIDLEYDDEYICKKCQIPLSVVKNLRLLLSKIESYEELKEHNGIKDLIQEQDDIQSDIHIMRLLESENIVKRNCILLKALNTLSARDKKLLLKIYGLDGNIPPQSISELKEEFGYKGSLIYKRQRLALNKLVKNDELREAYYSVDRDYDYNLAEKTYYLQK